MEDCIHEAQVNHSARRPRRTESIDPIHIPGGAFPSQEKQNVSLIQKVTKQLGKRCLVLLVIIIVLVLGGIIGGIVAAILKKNKNNPPPSPSADKPSPIDNSPSSATTGSPALLPSFHPSASSLKRPSQAPNTGSFRSQMLSFIRLSVENVDSSPSSMLVSTTINSFEDPSSSQSLALDWMVTKDELTRRFFLLRMNERLIQRFALITLWYATGGPSTWGIDSNGVLGNGWLNPNVEECKWNNEDFDDCLSNGFVTRLSLGEDGLSGSLPPEVGLLTTLVKLSLPDNRLTGNIPSELGRLTALTWLDLDNNDLTGNIPSQLGSLTPLTFLDIDDNKLTGSIPSELGKLTALTFLDLDINRLTGNIPSELGKLTALTFLDLDNNRLTGNIPSELGNLGKLRLFFLFNNTLIGTIPSALCNSTTNIRPQIDCGEIVCECCTDNNDQTCP